MIYIMYAMDAVDTSLFGMYTRIDRIISHRWYGISAF